ncbi:hypothetical protein V2J09_008864 [Rumex salicifolius]
MDANVGPIRKRSPLPVSCLREIRIRADDIEDEEKGLKISKKDWKKLHVQIASYNNFPTAAGLACLGKGLAVLVEVCLVDSSKGKWEVYVSSRQKETSSTSGMRDSVETSLLLKHRAEMEEAIKNHDFPSFANLTCAD